MRENLFQVVDCSRTAYFSTSPGQSQHPWVARARSRRGNLRAGLTAPPGGDRGDEEGIVTLRFRKPRLARRPEARPPPRSRADAWGLEPVGPRRSPVGRTALPPLVAPWPPPGHPNPTKCAPRLRAGGKLPYFEERDFMRGFSEPYLTLNGARKCFGSACGLTPQTCARRTERPAGTTSPSAGAYEEVRQRAQGWQELNVRL